MKTKKQNEDKEGNFIEAILRSVPRRLRIPPCVIFKRLFCPPRAWRLGKSLLVGRLRSAQLRVIDPTVSRSHCVLWRRQAPRTKAGWFLADLGSRNGTWLNGTRIARATRLQHGDFFQIGRTNFFIVLLRS